MYDDDPPSSSIRMARDDALNIDDMGYVVGTRAFEKCFRLETALE